VLAALRYFSVCIFSAVLLEKFFEFSECACGRHFPAIPRSFPPSIGQSLNAPLICVAFSAFGPQVAGMSR